MRHGISGAGEEVDADGGPVDLLNARLGRVVEFLEPGGTMDEQALKVLRRHGWTPGEVLGAGMEGAVVDLSSERVGKIWHGRPRKALAALLDFGAALEQAPIPFGTSGVIDLLEQDGTLITIEHKVEGVPLRADALSDPPLVDENEARLMGDALDGLAGASDPRLGTLPILPGESRFARDKAFADSLADLTERRFRTTRGLLRREVGDIDDLVTMLTAKLREMPQSPEEGLIHGDLIPANVLIKNNDVSGILDFGFLTTLGDPQFDAAITASIFDMYGPNALESEHILSTHFVTRFGHDLRVYGLYRAAYAVITHASFGNDESDGHFGWCVAMLHRADIREAVTA